MPVIPVVNEQQRINPSSPVPIGSSEAGRTMDETVARLGGAVADLGIMLAKADKDSKTSMARDTAVEISNRYDIARKNLRARLSATHRSTSITSFSDEMAKQSKELADLFIGETEDPMVQKFLSTRIADIDNDSTTIELDQSLKLFGQAKQDLFTKDMGNLEQKARGSFMNPEYSLDEKLGRNKTGQRLMENRVTNTLDVLLAEAMDKVDAAELPANQVEATKRKIKRQLVEAAINGLTDQRTDKGYQEGLEMLNRFTTGVYDEVIFDTEAAEKKFDDIHRDWDFSENLSDKIRKREREIQEKQKERIRINSALIDQYKQNTLEDLGDMQRQEKAIMVENLKKKYLNIMLKDTTKDPDKVFETEIVPILPKLNLQFIKGESISQTIRNFSMKDEEIKKAAKELLDAEKSGDTARIKRAQDRLRQLQVPKAQGK